MLPPGRCRDQAAALGWVRDLVATTGWRRDRASAARSILSLLVRSMDWDTGLVTALTAARMAETARRSTRTVSRVLAWAVEQGLLIQAEAPAAAAFLGSTVGRTPTYAVYRPTALTPPAAELDPDHPDHTSHRHSEPAQDGPGGEEDRPQDGPDGRGPDLHRDGPTCGPGGLGDLPRSSGYIYPSRAPGESHNRPAGSHPRPDGRGPASPGLTPDPRSQPDRERTSVRTRTAPPAQPWPLYVIPGAPSERERALDRVLEQVGIAPGSITGRTRWTLRGLLRRWWDAGLAPAGVVHALGHHPDHPGQARSTLTSGVRDLGAVAGARLRPWNGRLEELPDAVRGHLPASRPDHLAQAQPGSHAARQGTTVSPIAFHDGACESGTAASETRQPTPPPQAEPGASPEHRARLRAWLDADLTRRRRQRAGPGTRLTRRRPGPP